jgi:hypothetical protein
LLHGKRLFIATSTPTPGAGRDGGYIQNPVQQAQQQAHLVSLKSVHRLLAGELIKAINAGVLERASLIHFSQSGPYF